MVKHLTSEEFKEEVFDYTIDKEELEFNGEVPAIVDFYADWCGPCRMVAPILEELATTYDGKLNIYKVDVDSNPEVSSAFSIRSIPSILFIPMDGKARMLQGAMGKLQFVHNIETILNIKLNEGN